MRRSFLSARQQPWLLLLLPIIVECTASKRHTSPVALLKQPTLKFGRPQFNIESLLDLRGGGSTATTTETTGTAKQRKYPMEQLLLLQARSSRLREVLMERGLLQDYTQLDANTVAQPVDWDCALATTEHPKSCLYSFDAEPHTKVVAPLRTTQWISLGSLNRLRRSDPTKVEPLWHSQYAIFQSWFKAGSPYSLYAFLPWQGYLLAVVLDVPLVLNAAVLAVIALVLYLTRPLWESVLTIFLTSTFLWKKWPSWGRFVHAALPFKLLLGQMGWKGLTSVFGKIKSYAREYLVQVECRVWEEAIPLTILEGRMLEKDSNTEEDDILKALAAEEDDDDAVDEDENDDDSDEHSYED